METGDKSIGIQMKSHFLWTALTGTYCLLWATTCGGVGDENCNIVFLNNKILLTEWKRQGDNLQINNVTVESIFECQRVCCNNTLKCNMFEFIHSTQVNNCAYLYCDQLEKCLESSSEDYNGSTTYVLNDDKTIKWINITTTTRPSVSTSTATVYYNRSKVQIKQREYTQDPKNKSIIISSESKPDIDHSIPATISNIKKNNNSDINKIDHYRNNTTTTYKLQDESLTSTSHQQQLRANFSMEPEILMNWNDKEVLNDSYINETSDHVNDSQIVVKPLHLSNTHFDKNSYHHPNHRNQSENRTNNERRHSFVTNSIQSLPSSSSKMNPLTMKVKTPDTDQAVFLIVSLIIGFLILLLVIALIFKHVHSRWERRHYQKMDLMN